MYKHYDRINDSWLLTPDSCIMRIWGSSHWRHNDHDGVSNHQPHGCLLNRLFRRRSKKTSKLRVTGLCVGNSPGPVNSPHKGPVTRKVFPFDDVIMYIATRQWQKLTWLISCIIASDDLVTPEAKRIRQPRQWRRMKTMIMMAAMMKISMLITTTIMKKMMKKPSVVSYRPNPRCRIISFTRNVYKKSQLNLRLCRKQVMTLIVWGILHVACVCYFIGFISKKISYTQGHITYI